MKLKEAQRVLSARRARLKDYHVKSLAVFGSVARDEACGASDIDLLVEFEDGARIGLFELIELKQFLEGLLGCSVDLGTPDALRPRIRDRVLREAVRVA